MKGNLGVKRPIPGSPITAVSVRTIQLRSRNRLIHCYIEVLLYIHIIQFVFKENEIRCNLPVLENGRYLSSTPGPSVGASIRAVCNQGYVIEDTRSGDEIQCQKGGNWDRNIVCIGTCC